MTQTGSTAQAADTTWAGDLVHARVTARQVVSASYESSAVTFEEYARKVITYAKSKTEQERRELTRRRLCFLRDAWGPLLKKAFGNWVTPVVADLVLGAGKDHLDLSRNPAKHIWQELAVLYKQPARRSTSDGKNGEKYVGLLKSTDFDTWWQMVELLTNACNEVVIWPDVIERRGEKKIKHRIQMGNTLTAVHIESDPTEIECWVVIDEFVDLDGKEHTRYRIWTDEWHGEFEEEPAANGKQPELRRVDIIDPNLISEKEDTEGDFTVVNPYGVMPQVRIRLNSWQDVVWDQTTGEDLIDLTLHGGIDRCFYRYLQKVAGFKQGVVSGDIDDEIQGILDPSFLLQLIGQNINFQVVDWQVDLKSRLDCAMADELAAAAARGINPERYKRTASYQTSFGARLAERGLSEYRIRNAPIFARAEREYYKMLCIVAEKHGLDAPDPEADFEVVHQQIAFPDDPQKQIEVEKEEISLGFESHKSALAKRHPEWTEKQVEEQLEKNMEDIAKVNDMKTRHNVPDDPTAESASAEEHGRMGPAVRDGKPVQPPPRVVPRTSKNDRE